MAIELNSILNRVNNRQDPGGEGFGKLRHLETEGSGKGKSFSDTIEDAINAVDSAQKTADQNVEDVLAGRSDNVHEVMISMEKARLSFQMMLEIRNKAVDTYKELSRIQI